MNQKIFEDYVKAIYQICAESHTGRANTSSLARVIGVTDGTVSTTIRNLANAGLVVFTPYEGAWLTETGRCLALRVIRRHRLVELLLATVLDLDWSEVHEDAELLEHAVSERLADRIDSFLGHPTVDPHGDPIPTRDGSMPVINMVSWTHANRRQSSLFVACSTNQPRTCNIFHRSV